jgi:pyruvate formate lyase activating enzyme
LEAFAGMQQEFDLAEPGIGGREEARSEPTPFPQKTTSLAKLAFKTCQEQTALVLNIMRFAVRDGPGIRTTVFLKGCPLRCEWCHNPESQSSTPELIYFPERCVRCGDCVRACSNGALQLDERVSRDPNLCQRSGKCVDACSAGAQELAGRRMTVSEVMTAILKDEVFFDESGGGVTISGGEPLMQAAFVERLLEVCRDRRIRTVVDTCGSANSSVIRRVSQKADLFLYDVKLMDSERHRRYTGAGNELILQNLEILAETGSVVIVRVPIIPEVNDDWGNIDALGDFLSRLGLKRIDLLPYHRIGSDKYRRLGRSYEREKVKPPTAEHMQAIAARLTAANFAVRIGG